MFTAEIAMRRIKVSECTDKWQCARRHEIIFFFYFVTCVVGWQSFSFYFIAVKSKISLDGKWEIVIPVLTLIQISLIAVHAFLSILKSASCDAVSLLI